MGSSFPEVVAGAVELPDATALDGELVVWDAAGRLAFERLQNRLARCGAGAARAAQEWPAHFVAFDLPRLSGTDTTGWPYRRRRAALDSVFAARRLIAPWALCPSTTEADVVREWLSWASVGMEGVIFKRLDDAYRPSVRSWQKYKVRETSEAIVGAITGPLAFPAPCCSAGTTTEDAFSTSAAPPPLPRRQVLRSPGLLARGRRGHPWTGWSFSAGWGSQEKLTVTLVEPELVVEVGVDVARDAADRWRHPARWHRARPDLSPADVTPL